MESTPFTIFFQHYLQESLPVLGPFAVQFGDHLQARTHVSPMTMKFFALLQSRFLPTLPQVATEWLFLMFFVVHFFLRCELSPTKLPSSDCYALHQLQTNVISCFLIYYLDVSQMITKF